MYPSAITIIIVVIALLVLYVTGRSLAYVFKTTEEKLKSEPSVLTELDELRRSLDVKTTMYEMAELDLINIKEEFNAYKKHAEGYISQMEAAIFNKDARIAGLEAATPEKELSKKLWHSRREVAKLKRDLVDATMQIAEIGEKYSKADRDRKDNEALYNSILAQYAELKVKLNAIEQDKPNVEPKPETNLAGLEWAKWVATEDNGEIWAYSYKPKKLKITWEASGYKVYDQITPEQSIALCGRVPLWDDTEPTPCL